MLKYNWLLILLSLTFSPLSWGGFQVYTGNLTVYEDDSHIHYGSKNISNKQCLRSRYGRVDSAWPCVIHREYLPGDVRNQRLYIETAPYGAKLFSPGLQHLIATKP